MATYSSASHHIARNSPPIPHLDTYRDPSTIAWRHPFEETNEPPFDTLKLVFSVLSLLVLFIIALRHQLRDQPMDSPARSLAVPFYLDKAQRFLTSATSQLRGTQYLVDRLSSLLTGDNELANAVAARLPSARRNTQPPGLGNADFSCFQNSIIQGFASLKSLQPYLDQALVRSNGENSPMTQFLNSITRDLNDRESAGKTLLIPKVLQTIQSSAQQDAQEYYSTIVESLDEEVRKCFSTKSTDVGLKPVDHNRLLSGSSLGDITWIERMNSLLDSSLPTAFENPLEGHFADRLGCVRCGYSEGLRLTPFNCITLSPRPDIRECLDQYMELERIEDVDCPKCTLLKVHAQLSNLLTSKQNFAVEPSSFSNDCSNKENSHNAALISDIQSRLDTIGEALEKEDFSETLLKSLPSALAVRSVKTKQTVIARAPKAMVLHVNRSEFDLYTSRSFKNNVPMAFPETLNIFRWCLDSQPKTDLSQSSGSETPEVLVNLLPATENENPKNDPRYDYRLRAVITHRGHHESGHFICYRKFSLADFPDLAPGESRTSEDDIWPGPTHRWYELSDERVWAVPESKVFGQVGADAFMLFYEKIRIDDVSEQEVRNNNNNNNNDTVVRDSDLKDNRELEGTDISSGSEQTTYSTSAGSEDSFTRPPSVGEKNQNSSTATAFPSPSHVVKRTGFVDREISMSSPTEKTREALPV